MGGRRAAAALVMAAVLGGIFGLLVGLGVIPLPGIGPPAGAESLVMMIMSALLGTLGGAFFGGVLCLFVLSIVSRRAGQR